MKSDYPLITPITRMKILPVRLGLRVNSRGSRAVKEELQKWRRD